MAAAPKIVLDEAAALLFLGEGDVEVEIEVAAKRRRPGEAPPHPPSVGQEPVERRARYRHQRDVVVRQVHDASIEAVCDCRAGYAAGLVVRSEHEVIDKELRASLEQVRQRHAAPLGLERIVLVDRNPRQILPPLRQFVTAARMNLLVLKQRETGLKPFLARSDNVRRHFVYLP